MNRNRTVILIAGLGTTVFAIGGLAVVLLLLSPLNPFRGPAPSATPPAVPTPTPDPQFEAFNRLQSASEQEPALYFEDGFPRGVLASVPVTGADPVERARNFLRDYRDLYLQDDPNLALAVRRVGGPSGENVVFYQTYKALPVYGGELVVNLNGDRVISSVGGLLTAGLDLDPTPALTVGQAADLARAAIGVPDAPLAAPGALVIFDRGLVDEAPSNPRLAWQILLAGAGQWEVLVDAHAGEVLSSFALELGGAGLEDFDLDLEDANNANALDSDCYWSTTDNDNIGDEDELDEEYQSGYQDALKAWEFSRQTYLFYHNTYGRHSYDGDDGELEVYVYASVGDSLARWVGGTGCDLIEFDYGQLSYDIMVHEFTHGVVFYTSGLANSGQPRSLNESFSDTMAAVADSPDWTIGEGRTGGGPPIRDMANMTASDMSKYDASKSAYYNMGIPDTAAYLIGNGGTLNGVTVQGIGRGKLGGLYYWVLGTVPSGAKFIDARNAAVTTATLMAQWTDLNDPILSPMGFGFTANDVCQVRNAFYAVGLGASDLNCDGVEDNANPDGDSIPTQIDNCPAIFNPDQADADFDGKGDKCDSDADNDGLPNVQDNCWLVPNPDQIDLDHNSKGKACDPLEDPDDDNIPSNEDNCDNAYNPEQTDANFNGKGKACDPSEDEDFDDDGVLNEDDNCFLDYNPNQANVDSSVDGEGDACDPDQDGDGWSNDNDNCPFTPNPDQADSDGDGLADACDKCSEVSDGASAWTKGIPELGIDPQPVQPDSDGDGIPNACDSGGLRTIGRPGALIPGGPPQDVDPGGDPGDLVLIPLPICPPDRDGWSSEDRRELLTLDGLPDDVRAFVVDGGGRTAGKQSSGGSARGVRFKPLGGLDYFLGLAFGPGHSPDSDVRFSISMACGPKDELNPPPTATPTSTGTATTMPATPTETPSPTPTSTPTRPAPTRTLTPTPTFTPVPSNTPAPDTAGPSIGPPSAAPNPNGLPSLCRAVPPTTVNVSVSDPAGVAAVYLHVTYRGVEQVIGMTGGAGTDLVSGQWVVPADANGGDATFFIRAVDVFGNTSTGGNGVITLSRTVCP